MLSGPEVSQAEIEFYISLPDKLRKLYYSRSEQLALLSKCEQEFLPHDHAFERAQQRFSDFQFGFKRDPNSTSEQHLLRTRSLSLSDDSSVSPHQASFDTSSTQEEEADNESSIFYIDTMSTPSSRKSNRAAAPRRTMSLTTSSVQYSSSSAMLTANPAGFALAPAPRSRQHSSSLSGRRSLQTPTPPIFDPEATYYQDPETRKKLRTYLVSPQKFDEAIEFGFPSASDTEGVTPHFQLPPITNHSRKFSRDMQTFLRDGKLSFFEETTNHENQGLESDEDSVPDAESPATPSSTGHSFRLHSRQISHSRLSPVDQAPLSPTYQKFANLNREMTLRMTLTRPDLRANDEELYGWQPSSPRTPKDDPLALEDLVVTDDTTGTKGAFYVKPKPRGNLVARMLKRASLKGR